MVAKIGSIENFISHVIHPMIDSSFRNQASSTSAMNFKNEQKKAEEGARLELERYHVECVSVLICQINLPPELMKTQTERIIEIAKQIAEGNIKVTPDFLVQGNENLGGLLSAYLTQSIANKPKPETIMVAPKE